MRRLDRVPDVLPIPLADLADAVPPPIHDGQTIARVGPDLFAADVELRGAVDGGESGRSAGRPVGRSPRATLRPGRCGSPTSSGRRAMPGIYLRPTDRMTDRPPDVLPQPLASPFSPEPALPIPPEATGSVEDVGAVDPERSRLDLGCDVQRQVDVLRPHTGCQTVPGVVGQLDGFFRGSEGHQHDHRTKDLDLSNGRRRRYIGEQRRGEEPAVLR